uniref:Uncharacterized protein n=1 Tax=Ciona intestinalis TaxID=7719 RepID=H2XL51_CIOIN
MCNKKKRFKMLYSRMGEDGTVIRNPFF